MSIAILGSAALIITIASSNFETHMEREAAMPYETAQYNLGQDLRNPGDNFVQQISVNCSGSAQKIVSQTKGQLLSATPATQNGKTVCKITVLVGGADGQRPKKISVTVPQ